MTGLPSILDESLDRIAHGETELGISESMNEDSFDLDDPVDDDTFELPLKPRRRILHASNFADLETEPALDKRVRFQAEGPPWSPLSVEKIAVPEKGIMNSKSPKLNPTSGAGARKPHIEDLIQHAHSLNRYLDQNLDRINTFQSHMFDQDLEAPQTTDQMLASNVATAPTTPSGSISNFQLSEVGDSSESLDYEQDIHDESISAVALQDDSERDDRKIKQLLSKYQTSTYPLSENQSSVNLAGDDSRSEISALDHFKDLAASTRTSVATSSEDLFGISPSPVIRDLTFSIPKIAAQRSSATSPLDTSGDAEPPDMDCEAALALYTTTITLLLMISKQNDSLPEQTLPSFATFVMESVPTLAYEDYLKRLHCKFSFAPIVYLTAAHLLQTLFLTRVDEELHCKHHLDPRQVHRLVIASIRLATKLLEDCVHSHSYFSRICGISKKLLTKLEVAFLECLNYEGLKITNQSLLDAARVQQELSALTA
ncbi:LAQU0S08e03510g1_1 [Lachancea quebecensis]|uniref:LAQU0S08e03510g1_1 n=1 Tax=Lachancea quebecensis TaxID=1654605 RepID=A0A0P1KT12_9SACH|nr:LAQU0S08e03510g1_1 [Lachancea quebecensis]